jgi:hypothetical protein
MFGPGDSSTLSPAEQPLRILLVSADPARRAFIEQGCIAGVPHASVECLPDVPSAMFRLAANAFHLAVLDEVSIGPSPAALESMMKSLSYKVAMLTVVAPTVWQSRNRVLTEEVTDWVSNYYRRWARR